MMMDPHQSKDTIPPLRFSPITLKDMASSQYAFVCWCHELNNPNFKGIWGNGWFKERTFRCEDILPVPAEIIPPINRKIQLIGKELENWMVHHQFLDFIPRQVVANCISFLNIAGDICYKQTAKNLLKANFAFNLREQFQIACKYCFEEDVKRLWCFLKDDVSLHGYSFDIKSRPGHVHTMDYWCSLMRGELKELYGYGSEEKSPEWFVISNRPSTTKWEEMEYYWCKLNDKERIILVHRFLTDNNFTKHMIFKWNEYKLQTGVRIGVPYQILLNLAENELYYHYTLQVWCYVKNYSIANDIFVFRRFFIKLLPMAFSKPKQDDHMVKLIKKIWISTPKNLKNFICTSNKRVQLVFEISKRYLDVRFFGRDLGFFIQLLRDTSSIEIRNQVWLKWWRKLITVAKISDLIELTTLCFHNKNDFAQFKKKTMLNHEILQDVFTQFIKYGHYNEFADYLKFCSSDIGEK